MRFTKEIALLSLLLGIALGGCDSIPLSTLWHMSGFSADDIAQLDARQIRAAILLPDGYSLKPGEELLKMDLTETEAEDSPGLHYSGQLTRVATGRTIPLDVPAADARHHWELYRLDPAELPALQAFQTQYIERKDALHHGGFNVHFGF